MDERMTGVSPRTANIGLSAVSLILLVGCASTGSPKLTVAPSEVIPILDAVAVVPVEFSSERRKPLDWEIRARLEALPGDLLATSSSDECDEGDWVAALNTQDNEVDAGRVPPLDEAKEGYLRCLAEEGATAVVVPRIRSVRARFNLGMAFFCGGKKSIRPIQENPFATPEPSRHEGMIGATCLAVSLYRLDGHRLYKEETPFATSGRLRSNVSGGFVDIPFDDSVSDPDLRREAIDEVVAPLVREILQGKD